MKNNLPLAYIEISKKNLIHNIKQFRGLAKRGTKISAVIKGNAYGHGQNEVAKILEPYVDYFQVNSFEELELLRKVSKKKNLLLGYVQMSDLPRVLKLGCVLSTFSLEQLEAINSIASRLKTRQEIHLPIDAHLGREGFLEKDLRDVLKTIKEYKNLKLIGIYAHFANIEDTTNLTHTNKQIALYKRAVDLAKELGYKNLETHISATSGLLVYEKGTGVNSIVRIGIGIYGMWPSEAIREMYKGKTTLRPVLTLKTKVAQIKTLERGENIGYGLSYITKRVTMIAVIPVGYSNGLDRRQSNNGEVLIKGARCKILGRVAMNMLVVDVSELKNVKAEDEVVLIGRQGKEEILAEEIAQKIGTINYEITTRLSALLPRIII